MAIARPPLILYHADCDDGFGAAYAAWTHFGAQAEYRPVHHGDPVAMEPLAGRAVFILDFSFSPETVAAMAQVATQVTLLDHHKSAAEQWQGITPPVNAHIRFDMNRSGAQLAWDYFHPEVVRPALIDHIGDRDLWRFALPDTRAFCAGLGLQSTTFDAWQAAAGQFDELVAKGRIALEVQQRQIDKAVKGNLRSVTLCGHRGLAANVINNPSEVGNEIAKRSGTFSLTFFIKGENVICSLRSLAPFDVSTIATHYGGGGHAQASGFVLSVSRFFAEVWR